MVAIGRTIFSVLQESTTRENRFGRMKIATYNVNSIRIRLDTVLTWLEKHSPDVLCIQETKCQDEAFPLLVMASSGYHIQYRGMKSYNGVAVLTREAPDEVAYGFDDQ